MDFNKKKIMHIDMSTRFFQKGVSGVAFKIINSGQHKGIVLNVRLKNKIKEKLAVECNYPKLYAIFIYYLIYESLDLFDMLVICNDEKYFEVKEWLDVFFNKSDIYKNKEITSISYFRKITNNKNIRSYADKVANIYRNKGCKIGSRQQRGISLNLVKVDFNQIELLWRK